MSSRYSYSNEKLFNVISVECPYVVEILDERIMNESSYWHDDLTLLLMGFFLSSTCGDIDSDISTRSFLFFGIKYGKWNKLRKSIMHYVRTNEDLINFKLL